MKRKKREKLIVFFGAASVLACVVSGIYLASSGISVRDGLSTMIGITAIFGVPFFGLMAYDLSKN